MSGKREEKSQRPESKTRGVFERPVRSGVWWVCYFDEKGKKHREKVGPKRLPKVYAKTEVMGNVEPNSSNDTMHLVIDVKDTTDY